MEPALKLALTASGVFLLTGLLTGVWKYACIARSPTATAPVYVDIAHRAALLYSFAALVIAMLAHYSPWPEHVDLFAVFFPVLYFALAIGGYVIHGLLRDTDNQFLKPHVMGRMRIPPAMLHFFMWTLIVAEIGGVGVLFAGFVKAVLLS